MNSVQIIHFTQDQARTITGVTSETLRHWRKSIPYLAEKTGKSARFSFTDLICIASTVQAVETFGVSISSIGLVIDSLFRKLSESRSTMAQYQAVVISSTEASLCRFDEIANIDFSKPTIVIPLDQLMANVRQCLLPESQLVQQMQIPFSPYGIAS